MNLFLALLTVLTLTSGSPAPAVPPPTGPPVSSAPSARGVWPLLPHDVVAGFDPPDADWETGHRGVDLLGIPGQQVRAALPGTVTFAGVIAGRGVVVVSHGDLRTTYEPVTAWVRVGDAVADDRTIGVLEPGANHCSPRTCLHWGAKIGEEYVDPLTLVGATRVRLLPLG